jgi:haloalkane dehalogenase
VTGAEVVAAHEAAGHRFRAGGVESFVREEGSGEAVVCVHGVPTSSFLYRKVIAELARHGLRGVAFDLPGLGLADRPRRYDYTWTGLGGFCAAAVDALGIERFHLVVHDIGGPVGFEVAVAEPERIRSLTVLNTMVEVDRFKRPWFMEPYAIPVLGELVVASMTRPTFRELFYRVGIEDRVSTSHDEVEAHFDLLKRTDGGRAFLRIMRGFERTPDKARLYVRALRGVSYPVQVVWGANDPALTIARHGEEARRAAELDQLHAIPAKHFLQEDQPGGIASRVAELAGRA